MGPHLAKNITSPTVTHWSSTCARHLANVVTEHHVTHPEITVDGGEASGIWYLQDRVIVAEFDFMLVGAAFYHDTYRKTPDGWKISATGYQRTYDATLSLKALDFKLFRGDALN